MAKRKAKKDHKIDYKYYVALVFSLTLLAMVYLTNVNEVLAGYIWGQ